MRGRLAVDGLHRLRRLLTGRMREPSTTTWTPGIKLRKIEPARVHLDDAGGFAGLREEVARRVFQDPKNEAWLQEANRAWKADVATTVLGRSPEDFDPGQLAAITSVLEREIRHTRQAWETSRGGQKKAIEAQVKRLHEANAYLQHLAKSIDRQKQRAYHHEVGLLRADAQSDATDVLRYVEDRIRKGPTTPQEIAQLQEDAQQLGNHLERLRARKKALDDLAKRSNITRVDNELVEVDKRIRELDAAKQKLRDLRRTSATRMEAAEKEASAARAERMARRGETVTEYEEMIAGERDARRILHDSAASAEARDDAEAFLRDLPAIRKRVAQHNEFNARFENRKQLLRQYKEVLSRTTGTAERARVQADIDRLGAEIRQMKQVRDEGATSPSSVVDRLGVGEGVRRRVTDTKVRMRHTGVWWDQRVATPFGGALKSIRKTTGFQAAAESLGESAKLAGYGWLWRAQARRYRAQEEQAREAQRTARSSAWEWYYRFSRPVRRVVIWSLALAPVMVPWGIFHLAGWMVFAVFAFLVNMGYAAGIEVFNLALFGILSLLNVSGSLLQGFVDKTAATLFGALQLCPSGINTPDCAYQSLNYHFGVNVIRASPLIDPRFFYPTIFQNNSILSVLLDFLGGVSAYWVLAAGALLVLLWPLMLMEGQDTWKRGLTTILILLVTVPAFIGQEFLQSNFYAAAADLFRTGYGNILDGPARALAEQARDAVQNAQFPTIGGGPAA